jgi:hypothetical protein
MLVPVLLVVSLSNCSTAERSKPKHGDLPLDISKTHVWHRLFLASFHSRPLFIGNLLIVSVFIFRPSSFIHVARFFLRGHHKKEW